MIDLVPEIYQAESRIRDGILETPVERSTFLSRLTGVDVYLKLEHLQKTGSFKARGAMNRIESLGTWEGRAGVVCASTGNHGLGVAYAAHRAGFPAMIYVPRDTAKEKIDAMEAYGATVMTVEGDCLFAELEAREAAAASGRIFISPYNDPWVMAGQGTLGLELARQLPNLDAVFLAVGGGGLIGGVGTILKSIWPNIQIVGGWPTHAPALARCLDVGRIFDVAEEPTLSTSTAGGVEPNSITFPICQHVIDQRVLVSEGEIAQGMLAIAEHHHWLVEGAAGVAVAAFLQRAPRLAGKRVAIVLCGRNIPWALYRDAMDTYTEGAFQWVSRDTSSAIDGQH